MIERYGKSSGPLLSLKKDFIDNNDSFLKKSVEINSVYLSQERRDNCKNCNNILNTTIGFFKQDIQYVICDQCGHLNGLNQDSDDFCSALYVSNGGEDYAKNYTSRGEKDYKQRVNDIYLPKAKFLLDSLKKSDELIDKLKFSDLGAGSGYFVNALMQLGVKNSNGFEVSEVQVELGNAIMKEERLTSHSLSQTVEIANTVESDVVTMIGVLEHFQNPRDIITALYNNNNVRYLYLSVPLFSPTVFFEIVFPGVMQRQLSEGHTHLYTESSLDWMANEFGMKKVAAWWFGTDMVDLYRNIMVKINKKSETKKMIKVWNDMFIPLIDSLQLEIDKKHLSSEVHILFKFES
jgi:2-polyprenyl-3-methyl-5-hydroxy-6-metoxy-1,4-benzoquinol methylase